MPDFRARASLETVLKQFRDELAHVDASILALENLGIGGRPSPSPYPPMKSGRAKAVPLEYSDTIKRKHSANPLADGYAEIHLAARWPPEADSWIRFMRKVIRLPVWMLPVVQRVIHRRAWRKAAYPLDQVRAASNREAARLGLRGE